MQPSNELKAKLNIANKARKNRMYPELCTGDEVNFFSKKKGYATGAIIFTQKILGLSVLKPTAGSQEARLWQRSLVYPARDACACWPLSTTWYFLGFLVLTSL